MSVTKTVLSSVAALVVTAMAQADELKLAHFASTKYHLHVEMFVPLAEKLAEATGGETTIRIYPGGELGAGPVKQYDRVIDGVADIVYALPGYTASQFKKSLLVEIPGIVKAGTNKTEALWSNIEMLDEEFRRTKLLGLWTAGNAVLLTAEKRIEKLSDLEGLKFRVPSKNTGRLIEAWGATAVSMPITQVYQSMETGVVDGTLVDTSVLTSFKLGEVTKYVTVGMNATNSVFMLLMNRDSWDSLDGATQDKLTELTGAAMSEGGRITMTNASDKALDKWLAEGGELIELSPEAAAEFNAASDNLAATVIVELDGEGIDASGWAAALRN
ncbi:MAG: TRAP transporter substrate-binding protein [Rhodobacteraceae bacterium]|nr:TRAP transporter substrate-binding protein [Paracoccaceae bacterium]MCY4140168.1 TRAP transporter substrate-binding protein [Paracoccaceae bacterium]